MKLFQKLLVAGTGISLLAPMAVSASEVYNLDAMSSYKRSEKKAKRFDNKSFINNVNNDYAKTKVRYSDPQVKQKYLEAGTFSDTTTLDSKLVYSLGGADTDNRISSDFDGKMQASFTYTMNLNTSFTGDDNLYTRLKDGNHTGYSTTKGEQNTYLVAGNGNNRMKLDKIWYSRPIGDRNTIWIGPRIENYYMHGTTPSIYKPVLKAFTLGGNAAAYGASTSPGAGWAYKADNGFAVSSNFTSKDGHYKGLLTDEAQTSWATQVGYTKPQYSVSAIINNKYGGWSDSSYYTSDDGMARPGDGSSTNIGYRAWWRPDETGTPIPSMTFGYDTSTTNAATDDHTSAYFVGLNWQDIITADDRIGLAFGQPQKREDDEVDPFLYEFYYEYKVNDALTLTPTIFGGTHEDANDNETEMTGYVLNTTFKF
jgi:hypothetical protein